MKNVIQAFFMLLSAVSCQSNKIVDRPINFDQERVQLSLDYLDSHYHLKQETPVIDPKMVVIHWTAIPSLEKSFNAFKDNKLPNWRPDIATASALNVSSQFLVDQDGTIYRLMSETTMARHVIGLNHCAIGIENVGGGDQMPFTAQQLDANIWLVRYLKEKYDIQYLIGHYEYTLFDGHDLWLEVDKGYRTVKTDPGKQFMKDIRTATSDLTFKPLPEPLTVKESVADTLTSN